MIWATVSSWFCFCWLYRASPSLTAKNIIKLIGIDHLVMSMCRVFFSVVGRGCLLCFAWQNSVSLCPPSFCTPRANLPVTPGISWLSIFAFQSPIMKRTSYPYLSESRQNENHNHRKVTKLITWTTALAQWNYEPCHVGATQRWAGHGGEFWQNVVHWRREWQTTSVFLPWEPHEQYEKAKRCDTERWTPQVSTCPIYYWRSVEK